MCPWSATSGRSATRSVLLSLALVAGACGSSGNPAISTSGPTRTDTDSSELPNLVDRCRARSTSVATTYDPAEPQDRQGQTIEDAISPLQRQLALEWDLANTRWVQLEALQPGANHRRYGYLSPDGHPVYLAGFQNLTPGGDDWFLVGTELCPPSTDAASR